MISPSGDVSAGVVSGACVVSGGAVAVAAVSDSCGVTSGGASVSGAGSVSKAGAEVKTSSFGRVFMGILGSSVVVTAAAVSEVVCAEPGTFSEGTDAHAGISEEDIISEAKNAGLMIFEKSIATLLAKKVWAGQTPQLKVNYTTAVEKCNNKAVTISKIYEKLRFAKFGVDKVPAGDYIYISIFVGGKR